MALENARLYETARRLADRDPLTGFFNHRYLHERLSEEVVRAVERAGFKLAFTTERGINDLGRVHPLQLQRINVGMRTTIPILRAQLLSLSATLYPLGKKVLG